MLEHGQGIAGEVLDSSQSVYSMSWEVSGSAPPVRSAAIFAIIRRLSHPYRVKAIAPANMATRSGSSPVASSRRETICWASAVCSSSESAEVRLTWNSATGEASSASPWRAIQRLRARLCWPAWIESPTITPSKPSGDGSSPACDTTTSQPAASSTSRMRSTTLAVWPSPEWKQIRMRNDMASAT